MRISDVMTRDVITVAMDATVEEIRDRLAICSIHHLVVTDRGQVVGVISDRDLLRHLSPFIGTELMERAQDVNTLRKRAHQVMTRQPTTIGPDLTVRDAAAVMLARRISSLPVVDGSGRLCGIVSSWDVLAAATGLEATLGPTCVVREGQVRGKGDAAESPAA